MDEKDGTIDGAYSNHFSNSPINRLDNQSTGETTFGSFENKTGFDGFNQDDLGSNDTIDTIDSMHKDFLSKFSLSRFTNGNGRREPPKPPAHLNSNFIPKIFSKRTDQAYFMEHKNRGKCIIINNTYFDSPTLPERKGTREDRDSLTACFKKLDYEVQNWDEYEALEIKCNIDRLAREDFTNDDSLVVCVLTHGDTNCLYAKDDKYYLEYLFDSFKSDQCKTLAGKPKIFIIQACRGDKLDNGSIINFDVEDSHSSDVRIPQWADFLMAYSTVPGYYSWRNTQNGSWFIQAFVTSLQEHYKEQDLLSILTITNQKVAYDFESNTPNLIDFHQRKQMPMIASMLTRKVFFNKPKPKKILFKQTAESKKEHLKASTSNSSNVTLQSHRRLTKDELLREQVILNEKMMNSQMKGNRNQLRE